MSSEIESLRASLAALQGEVAGLSQRFDTFQATLATLLAPITAQRKGTEECIRQGFRVLQTCLEPSTLRWLALVVVVVVGGGPASMLIATRLVDAFLPNLVAEATSAHP